MKTKRVEIIYDLEVYESLLIAIPTSTNQMTNYEAVWIVLINKTSCKVQESVANGWIRQVNQKIQPCWIVS